MVNVQELKIRALSDLNLLFRDNGKKSRGLIPTHPSQRYPRATKLHTIVQFPIFPLSRLASLFTGMLRVITFTS
jgi:hypothetical protein